MMKYKFFPILAACAVLASCSSHSGESKVEKSADTIAEATEEVAIAPLDTFSYAGYDMIADILAGNMPKDSSYLRNVTNSGAYATHRAEMKSRWDATKKTKVDVIREWAKKNLPENPDTVFYPFGGPDFHYLASFFPDAKYSVLMGLERPGKLPLVNDNANVNVDSLFWALRKSVEYNMRASFFVTTDMSKDLNKYVHGTLPVVLMFMSMHGYDVVNVNPVEVNAEGEIVYTDPANLYAHTTNKTYDKGYEVMYRLPGEKDVRKMVYLSYDLSNAGFAKNNINKMVARNFKGKTTFLKAASYLMHDVGFSNIRQSILDNSNMVITGLSGIPYNKFDKNIWDITLYGRWCKPITAFESLPQDDLCEAYSHAQTTPLGFRFDYGAGTTLFVARKK